MKKIVDVWVTRDRLGYAKWSIRPEWGSDEGFWVNPQDGGKLGFRAITEASALKLIGCKLKGGPRSIRRVKRPGRGEESK